MSLILEIGIEDVFPSACRVVLDVLKQMFDHDEEARDQQMSPEARLAYHQTLSQPLMAGLKEWLDHQLEDRLAEDNSLLKPGDWLSAKVLGNPDALFIRAGCATGQ